MLAMPNLFFKIYRSSKSTMKLYLPPRLAFDFCLVVWNSQQLVLHLNTIFPIVLSRVIYNSAWEGLVLDMLNTDELGEGFLDLKSLPKFLLK